MIGSVCQYIGSICRHKKSRMHTQTVSLSLLPPSLVIMGVSGCGKSTVGRCVADKLGWPFLEGDALHSKENIELMRQGVPLDDAMREPWLRAIADWIATQVKAGRRGVIACSALRRRYRDILRTAQPELRFVWLHTDRDTFERRLTHRHQHFMPASLLDSQLETLEPPGVGETAICLDATEDIATLTAASIAFANTR